MAERIKVTVRPSGAHPDVLTVQDAMLQVLDVFDLVSGGSDELVWRLVGASMNSPFWAEGEAVSLHPGVNVAPIARALKTALSRDLSALAEGRAPDGWRGTDRWRVAERLVARNMNGVGETDIEGFFDQKPFVITPRIAEAAQRALREDKAAEPLLPEGREHDEFGSIEGRLLSLTTDYDQPAIKVEDRRTSSVVTCRITDDIAERIATEETVRDVWANRRVLVRGRIRYGKTGEMIRVYADDVERIAPRHVELREIRDPNFTGGMGIAEYLERHRDGDFGA